MRLRNSSWKPFITDSTVIKAATPSAMPSIDTSEMKEMKRLRPWARLRERVAQSDEPFVSHDPGQKGPPVRKKPLLCRNCPALPLRRAKRGPWQRVLRSVPPRELPMPHHLIIPDLLWPAALTPNPSGGLALPALESILGRARLETAPPQSLERCLGELFGLASGPCRTPQSAARAGAGGARRWRGALCRSGQPPFRPRTPAARRCQRPRDQHSAGRADRRQAERDVFRRGPLQAAAPDRWYLWIAALPELSFTPSRRWPAGRWGLSCRRAATRASGTVSATRSRFGSTTTRWNAAREAAGLRPINSPLVLGRGRPPGTLRSPAAIVHAEGNTRTRAGDAGRRRAEQRRTSRRWDRQRRPRSHRTASSSRLAT